MRRCEEDSKIAGGRDGHKHGFKIDNATTWSSHEVVLTIP